MSGAELRAEARRLNVVVIGKADPDIRRAIKKALAGGSSAADPKKTPPAAAPAAKKGPPAPAKKGAAVEEEEEETEEEEEPTPPPAKKGPPAPAKKAAPVAAATPAKKGPPAAAKPAAKAEIEPDEEEEEEEEEESAPPPAPAKKGPPAKAAAPAVKPSPAKAATPAKAAPAEDAEDGLLARIEKIEARLSALEADGGEKVKLTPDLVREGLTFQQLRAACRDNGIEFSRDDKADALKAKLLAALDSADGGEEEEEAEEEESAEEEAEEEETDNEEEPEFVPKLPESELLADDKFVEGTLCRIYEPTNEYLGDRVYDARIMELTVEGDSITAVRVVYRDGAEEYEFEVDPMSLYAPEKKAKPSPRKAK